MICRCGHDLVLHNEEGECVALILTLVTWTAGCGCPEFRFQQTPKEKK